MILQNNKKPFLYIGACFALLCPVLIAQSHAEEDNIQALKQLYKRPLEIPYPESNPYSEEKDQLGKWLFFDPRLSASGTQSCATCHNPSLGWEDGMELGTGHEHQKLRRATPTILNLSWDELFFWDGRADSLEAQTEMPLESKTEMNMSKDKIVAFLKSIQAYNDAFGDAFPTEDTPVNSDNVKKAIATYMRGIVSGKAPFDHWIEGDEKALSDAAKRGFILFNKKANCAACHSGWKLSDNSFHDIGLPSDDIGRGELIPHLITMQHAFKTVGLRNIVKRAPYMHDGSFKTLEDVIDHYNDGFVRRESLSDEIKPLNLTPEEKTDLILFLKTLTSEDDPITIPILPKEGE